MAEIKRKAGVVWNGDLRTGNGVISTESKVLFETPYTFSTRFEDEAGTNPEELIAAAHAACFSMAFASTLKKKGYTADELKTSATCVMTPKAGGGFEISKMLISVSGKTPNIDAETFESIAKEADAGCPVSNLLRNGLKIVLDVKLSE